MDAPTPSELLRDAAASTRPAWLSALDDLLAAAVAHAHAADPHAAEDRWRGLYLSAPAANALAQRGGLLAGFCGDSATLAGAAMQDYGFGLLRDWYALPDPAVAVLALALAPEIDARYGQLYAYLQDDVTRRLPSAALALDLLSEDAHARESLRRMLGPGAPLAAQHILWPIGADAGPALTAPLRLDPQIRQALLDEPGLDPRLADCCDLRAPRETPEAILAEATLAAIRRAAAALGGSMQPLRIALAGPPGCGQAQAAELLAGYAGLPLLVLDAAALPAASPEARLQLALTRREALLANAVLCIENADRLAPELRPLLGTELARFGPAVLLHTPPGSWLIQAAAHGGFADILFEPPDAGLRRTAWRLALARRGMDLEAADADMLGARFRLTQTQIGQAATQAAAQVRCGRGEASQACFGAALAQGGHDLARLARRITPRFVWRDLVVPAAVEAQLREICARVSLGETVLRQWRFADKLSLGRGVAALFAGPSGAGKTMAAEVVAGALGVDLYKIDLASVVSKYIGETEQNLDRVFRAAEDVCGILLFDEADALFGKRSEVRDSHDRYANLEISYLLQKMEEFEGVALLSTNLQKNLDDAFTRRLAYIVHFPFPEEAERLRIWQAVWPDALPREPDLDFRPLARHCKLSGGNIKSAALAAAYLAAAEGCAVGLRHAVRAVEREYEKLGRPLRAEDVASLLGPRAAS